MVDKSQLFEKLGLFYLGQQYDLESRTRRPDLVLYESRDLVTHACCIGMTGSGKTGLGITLLEEAAIDGLPALVIDPKGDMTNLLLTFPDMTPQDLEPWIAVEETVRSGLSREALAEQKAATWVQGLADWGQTRDRIRMLKNACDFTIYTPGSDAGIPISILSSFMAPADNVRNDADLFQDCVAITATSVLSLLGITTDPLQSREHILLSTILSYCWQRKMDLDLPALIRLLQDPPVSRVGVIELETFFPAKDRFQLAMSLNNLLAAPGFASWMAGEPLQVQSLLYTPTGRPRISIFTTAHLSEPDRLFFTSLLLNQTLGWIRSRPGTTSLRALLYIDELFGYLPPTAEPPTKKPLLTLLKQARAYGLGIVLATQNPVDLDYKGLSNIGTWFLGRLQTERDKERVLDGLAGASHVGGSWDRNRLSNTLSSLSQRVFLMHNVHEDEPVVFQSRWALSYLAGPMTRDQIRTLMAPQRAAAGHAQVDRVQAGPVNAAPSPPTPEDNCTTERPVLPPGISEVFLPIRSSGTARVTYRPCLLAWVQLHYSDSRRALSADEELLLRTPLHDRLTGIDWSHATAVPYDVHELQPDPPVPGDYAELPAMATVIRNYYSWTKTLVDHLYRTQRYRFYRCPALREYSRPGEDEQDFRLRLADRAREERDRRGDALRARYAKKLAALQNRVRQAEHRVEREKEEARHAQAQSMISLGTSVLAAVLGRRLLSATTVNRASSAVRGASRAGQQASDVQIAQASLAEFQSQLEELEAQMATELQDLDQQFHIVALQIDECPLKPRRQDVIVRRLSLAWAADAPVVDASSPLTESAGDPADTPTPAGAAP